MFEAVLSFVLQVLLEGVAGPLRFLLSARYRASTRQRWARLSKTRVGFEIAFSLVCCTAALVLLGIIVRAVVRGILLPTGG